MPDQYREWMRDERVSQILSSWKADALNDEQQVWLEDLVKQGVGLNPQLVKKLKAALGLKPIDTKHFVVAIQDATSGFGRVGARDPQVSDDPNTHFRGGR